MLAILVALHLFGLCFGCDTPCVNGTCIGSSCLCDPGFYGSACDQYNCPDVNCTNSVCSSFDVCTCNQGWTGPDCSTLLCDPPCSALPNSVCAAPNTCSCVAGWTGADCQTRTCDVECDFEGGVCNTTTLTCDCHPGYSGNQCNTYSCTCFAGDCIGPNNCSCKAGWTGSACESPVCSPPCKNGVCLAHVQGNLCSCFPGFVGVDCANNSCPQGCINGKCTAFDVCTCDVGWYGINCTSKLCSQVCVHGTCTSLNKCTCLTGWGGVNCTAKFVPKASTNYSYLYYVIPIIVVVFFAILVGVCCCCARRSHRRRLARENVSRNVELIDVDGHHHDGTQHEEPPEYTEVPQAGSTLIEALEAVRSRSMPVTTAVSPSESPRAVRRSFSPQSNRASTLSDEFGRILASHHARSPLANSGVAVEAHAVMPASSEPAEESDI